MYNPNPYLNSYSIPAVGYQVQQPVIQQPAPQPQVNMSQQTITSVQGRNGANILANNLMPNSSVLAVDSTASDVLYSIVRNGNATPMIKRLRYYEDDSDLQTAPQQNNEYVTKSDFNGLSEQLSALTSKFNKLMEDLGDGKSNS